MQKYDSPEIINIGSGLDYSIKEMAEMIKKITDYSGKIIFDESKPDGTPRKLLNIDKIKQIGWNANIDLETGLTSTYADFISHYDYYVQHLDRRNPIYINV
jgi:GDP-L-fucose synthase